ncbi:MAG TPA: threonylcarbamoyl-AMP synthase [Leptospiraceae bacterium]|nr:threonylcarbamoyl-AMP synthase [Spirochaetaceae bacterium]HBS06024.1 threonylcarbamoyl-AMP synthase [Leptospiraceae bacterium]|tara:strand:+ start:31515 stop:32657 length:1143 start_codon:yes stop_codon:yes gene_type:complete
MGKYLDEQSAVELIQKGQCVALPTETVYGLACDALDEVALRNLYTIKGRPAENPVICHVSSPEMAFRYGKETPLARKLMNQYWPGPLTILLEHDGKIPTAVTAGSALCGFRMPDHEITLRIIEKCNTPLAIPSANKSGKTSPTTAAMALAQLEGEIPGVVDGGQCAVGLESTVLRLEGEKVIILRPGTIDEERLTEDGFTVESEGETRNGNAGRRSAKLAGKAGSRDSDASQGTGTAAVLSPEKEALLSPGLLPVHYQPDVDMFLIQEPVTGQLNPGFPHASYETIAVLNLNPEPVALIDLFPRRLCENAILRHRSDSVEATRNLYLDLYQLSRHSDALVVIAGPACSKAVMDRLQRAATGTYQNGKWQFRRSQAGSNLE